MRSLSLTPIALCARLIRALGASLLSQFQVYKMTLLFIE